MRFGLKEVANCVFFHKDTNEIMGGFGFGDKQKEFDELIRARNKTKVSRIRKKLNKKLDLFVKSA